MAVQYWFCLLLEWYDPRAGIDLVEDVWSTERFQQVSRSAAVVEHVGIYVFPPIRGRS